MKHLVLALAAVTLFASGCASRTYYNRPGASAAQEEQDYRECDFEAEKATGNMEDKDERAQRMQVVLDKCMRARGYKPN